MCTNCNELKYQIICMDLNSLWEKVLCPQYKAELLINDGLATHDHFNSISVKLFCINESKVRRSVPSTTSNSKVDLCIPLSLLSCEARILKTFSAI